MTQLPFWARKGELKLASLSARVASIGDNHLGGWYAYRASKAALNQLIHPYCRSTLQYALGCGSVLLGCCLAARLLKQNENQLVC